MAKSGSAALRRIAAATLGVALAAIVSACGTSGDMSRLLVAPGKYDIYSCPQIADRMQTTEEEGQKLEALIARASQDESGKIIGNIAYGPDYLANRGEMRELRKSAAAKNCTNLPAEALPGSRASDSTIH
jgi:hypothetical protein